MQSMQTEFQHTGFFYFYTETWNDKQPAWIHMTDIMDYVARNQLVLQTGTPHLDLAFFESEIPYYTQKPDPQHNLIALGMCTYDRNYLLESLCLRL